MEQAATITSSMTTGRMSQATPRFDMNVYVENLPLQKPYHIPINWKHSRIGDTVEVERTDRTLGNKNFPLIKMGIISGQITLALFKNLSQTAALIPQK